MINCRQCSFSSEPSKFTEHFHENGLKCLNPHHKYALYKSSIVAFDFPVKVGDRITECFICLVCKKCEVKHTYDALSSDKDQKTEFFNLHKSRCGAQFSEIADLLKPSDHELASGTTPIKTKKHPACPKCGYDANGNESNLRRHMLSCKGPKKQKINSCVCGYSDVRNLKRHMAHCKSIKKEESSETNVGNSEPSLQPLPPSPPPENTVIYEKSRSSSPIVRNEGLNQAFDILRQKFEPDDSDDDEEDEDGNPIRKVYSELDIVNEILKERNQLLAELKAVKAEKWLLECAARKLVGDTRRNLSIKELADQLEEHDSVMERNHKQEVSRLKKKLAEKEEFASTFETIKFGRSGRTSYDEDDDD